MIDPPWLYQALEVNVDLLRVFAAEASLDFLQETMLPANKIKAVTASSLNNFIIEKVYC